MVYNYHELNRALVPYLITELHDDARPSTSTEFDYAGIKNEQVRQSLIRDWRNFSDMAIIPQGSNKAFTWR